MAQQYGSGGTVSVTMEGPFAGLGGTSKLSSLTMYSGAWKGAASPYSQVVEVSGVSVNSKVDLQPGSAQLELMRNMRTAFTTENDGGVVTVYAIGEKPEVDITMQVTITEVVA